MRIDAINKIDTAIQRTNEILAIDKSQLLEAFLKELNRYRRLASDHWPLTDDEKETVDIGRVAVREFDNIYPEYTTLLSNLGVLLRQG
jgi:phosphoenolpyruvate carboxylase